MYTRIRTSEVARHTDRIRTEMEKLQIAIKRVGENWNDVVAQGIQTTHVNLVIGACNEINSELLALSTSLEADLSRLKELSKLATSTM